ncbi:hypothetical protein AXE80_01600 [Wenyingzhuangia fucanilytica]|uniref:Uncharacterized protein n=2 Tax=Wenyingzhuangia fucanilytica TaxID=1790137 RepID=A0A1B1Y2U7_9FLAO|nr:hypothetical protein AXE80_01600 [Wenyingzhuangia fucanilytica]
MTNQMHFGNKVEVNGSITFGDVSSGVESRKWTFPEGVVDIVDSDDDVTSTKNTVKAIFKKTGQHNVALHQVFKGDAYDGTTLKGKVLDTIIAVNVLKPVSVSLEGYKLNSDGSLGDALVMSDGALNEITASYSVRFIYTVEGQPEEFTWDLDNGGVVVTTDENNQTTDVKYSKMGDFNLSFGASRERPAGGNMVSYTDLIRVVPSTDPVVLENTYNRDGKIVLDFSREMDASKLNPNDFSVNITTFGGATITPSINTVTLDPTDGDLVIVELNGETVYTDDQATITYTKGTLATSDGVDADTFMNVSVTTQYPNVLETSSYDYGFENSTNANWKYLGWGAPFDGYTLDVNGTQVHSGTKSAHVTMNAGGGMIVGHKDNSNANITFPVEGGETYEVGVWVYLEQVGASTNLTPDLRLFSVPNTDWGVAAVHTFTDTFTTGQWVYGKVLVKFDASATESRFAIRGYNKDNTTITSFYMDDFTVRKVNIRP